MTERFNMMRGNNITRADRISVYLLKVIRVLNKVLFYFGKSCALASLVLWLYPLWQCVLYGGGCFADLKFVLFIEMGMAIIGFIWAVTRERS